ncbi:hypothetical protein ACF3DV_12405 [Chlorogloeopsis fritschii PCC 9212]|nr:hypothetical protein [Chlorogloeopsis fritschii]MBF2009352.1 hypothetical protein [Chlorogloeopsis fritschii C42_A2020_084]
MFMTIQCDMGCAILHRRGFANGLRIGFILVFIDMWHMVFIQLIGDCRKR